MKFPNKKFLKCIQLIKEVDIGILRPATLPQVTVEVVHIGPLRPANLPQVIMEDILVEADLGHKIPATLPLTIG